jgi:hypothetical protein
MLKYMACIYSPLFLVRRIWRDQLQLTVAKEDIRSSSIVSFSFQRTFLVKSKLLASLKSLSAGILNTDLYFVVPVIQRRTQPRFFVSLCRTVINVSGETGRHTGNCECSLPFRVKQR